jgi:endonuclease/exonuclease/phosphatase (EEP) superfamily protein YafD
MVLVIATFMPLLHPFWPLAAVAEHFALQVLMAAVMLGVLAVLLRRWRWLGIVAGIAGIQLWTIHPYWPNFVTGSRAAYASPGEGEISGAQAGEIKVVSLNVWIWGNAYAQIRDYLARSNADVIGLVEVSPHLKAELAALDKLYPYRVDCIGESPFCQEMLLSKFPLTRSGAGLVDNHLPMLTWAEIMLPGSPTAAPITFAVTHLSRPTVRGHIGVSPASILGDKLPAGSQAAQASNLAGRLRDFGPNLVLMGDFNAAPWSRVQQALRHATGLDNQGFVAPSWPSFLPAMARLPIDHILTRGSPHLLSFRPGPDVGSDHLPVEATITFAQP